MRQTPVAGCKFLSLVNKRKPIQIAVYRPMGDASAYATYVIQEGYVYEGRVRLLRPHLTQTIFLLTTFLSTHSMPLAINVYKNHPVFAGLIIHQRLLKSNCQAMRMCTTDQAIRSAGIRRWCSPAPIRIKLPARRSQRICYGLPEGWAHWVNPFISTGNTSPHSNGGQSPRFPNSKSTDLW